MPHDPPCPTAAAKDPPDGLTCCCCLGPCAGCAELERRISAGQNGAAILGARPGDGQGPSGHAAWLGGSHAGSGGGPGKLWSGVLLFFFFLAIWGCLVCTPKQKLLALSDDKAVKVV